MMLIIEKYICTVCGNHFILSDSDCMDSEIQNETVLVCSGCGVIHPVIGGIPRFVPVENYTTSFGYQWSIHKKTQLDSYTEPNITAIRNR